MLKDEQIRKLNIHLDRIATALEEHNLLKKKELEYWKYNAEFEYKKYEYNIKGKDKKQE